MLRPSLRAAPMLLAMAMGVGLPLVPARAHAQLPSLGDNSDMTVAAERQLGDRIMREIYRDPDYIDDPLLAEYVEGIWQPLRAAAKLRGELTPDIEERFAWQIMLIRDRSVNAFALPGGYMGVHLGLIAAVANRDELASVMAHELSHVTQRHIARMMTEQGRQTPLILGAMILGVIAAAKSNSPDAANAAIIGGQAYAVQNQLNFSRDMEREADRIGYGVMGQAGFNTLGFATMFEKLQHASRLNDNGSFPYLRSHPLTTQRIADMQLRQQLGGGTPVAPTPTTMEHAMLASRARVIANPTVDMLRLALGQAQSSLGAPLAAARQAGELYAGALAAMRLRDYDRAREFQARLVTLAAADTRGQRLVRLLGIEIDLAAGNLPQAVAALGTGEPKERPELILMAQAYARVNRSAETVSPLQTWMAKHPRDLLAMQWLATGYGAEGQVLRSLRTEAEMQALRYDYAAASDRLRAAQDRIRRGEAGRGPAENIEASIIDARLREVESLLREQRLER